MNYIFAEAVDHFVKLVADLEIHLRDAEWVGGGTRLISIDIGHVRAMIFRVVEERFAEVVGRNTLGKVDVHFEILFGVCSVSKRTNVIVPG